MQAVAVLSDGRVVTGGSDDTLMQWDPDQPGTGTMLAATDSNVVAASGRFVVTVKLGKPTIWQVGP